VQTRTQENTPITLQDIQAAARQIRGVLVRTPCTLSQTLSAITGAEVVLKFENLQFTGAFKERGALVKLLSLTPEQRAGGVIAMSAGNHAQAVAHHARRLGIPATIVMPRHTPAVKVERTRAAGATVILHGNGFDETRGFTESYASEHGLLLVHPYDDPHIIAGQGTIALEMLEDYPDLEALIVPVGGGGLIAGCAVAARGVKPDIDVIGAETAQFPSTYQALRGEPIRCGARTMADGIAVKAPGNLTLDLVRRYVDDVLLVEEEAIEEAVLHLLEVEKTVVEGAGAVGLAAVHTHRERFEGRKVGLVLSGGNIDLMILSSIIQRGLARSGRLVKLAVEMRDVPGGLADATRCLADAGANVVEVYHHRVYTSIPLQTVEVEFVLQTRGLEHVHQIVAALEAIGHTVRASTTDVG
jgi:threonine dehydratase